MGSAPNSQTSGWVIESPSSSIIGPMTPHAGLSPKFKSNARSSSFETIPDPRIQRPPKNQTEFNRHIHADDLERTVKIFEESVNTPCDYEVEYRFVRPDGEVRHIVELGELH